MKVFLVIGGWHYEGYSKEVKVFSNKNDAEKKCAEWSERGGYDFVEVIEQLVE